MLPCSVSSRCGECLYCVGSTMVVPMGKRMPDTTPENGADARPADQTSPDQPKTNATVPSRYCGCPVETRPDQPSREKRPLGRVQLRREPWQNCPNLPPVQKQSGHKHTYNIHHFPFGRRCKHRAIRCHQALNFAMSVSTGALRPAITRRSSL